MAVDRVANSVFLGEFVGTRQALHAIGEHAVVESDAAAGGTESEGRRAEHAPVSDAVVLLAVGGVSWTETLSTEVEPTEAPFTNQGGGLILLAVFHLAFEIGSKFVPRIALGTDAQVILLTVSGFCLLTSIGRRVESIARNTRTTSPSYIPLTIVVCCHAETFVEDIARPACRAPLEVAEGEAAPQGVAPCLPQEEVQSAEQALFGVGRVTVPAIVDFAGSGCRVPCLVLRTGGVGGGRAPPVLEGEELREPAPLADIQVVEGVGVAGGLDADVVVLDEAGQTLQAFRIV